jgi:hypothetical protein
MTVHIHRNLFLGRSHLAKHEQEQQVVEAVEPAAYYKRPAEARKSKKVAGKDWAYRSR